MPSFALKFDGSIAPPPTADVTITRGALAFTSPYRGAFTDAQTELRGATGDTSWGVISSHASVEAAIAGIQASMYYINQHIKAWQAPDPWPTPTSDITTCPKWDAGISGGSAADARWNGFDGYMVAMKKITDANGGKLVLTLCQAPFWMCALRAATNLPLTSDGGTGTEARLISDSAFDFSTITNGVQRFPSSTKTRTDLSDLGLSTVSFSTSYVNPDIVNCRVIDARMPFWEKLVYNCVRRAMRVYGVRFIQVWNEYKGYGHPSGSGIAPVNSMNGANTYDSSNLQGNITGVHATHGYTYMFNRAAAQIIQAGSDEGLLRSQYKIGGSYISHSLQNSSGVGGFPTSEPGMSGDKGYGFHDDRTLQPIKFLLQNHDAGNLDIMLLRASVKCKDLGVARPSSTHNIYDQEDVYGDLAGFVRNLNTVYPGQYPEGDTLPLWMSEWYSYQNPVSNSDQLHAALAILAHIHWIYSGGEAMLRWGGQITEDNMSLFSPTNVTPGGVSTLVLDALTDIANNFSAGKHIYTPTISDSTKVRAIMSDTATLVVNRSGGPLTASTPGGIVSLVTDGWAVTTG